MLDDLKLKNDLYGLLGALGSNTTLTELDIRSDNYSACSTVAFHCIALHKKTYYYYYHHFMAIIQDSMY